ncbi:MAG: zinc ribbon domain-containing protein [Gammaproteobacteria bacterium]|nr:zinc ribbon domain-containing protein [Gammaproteobacteria bacterium]
MSDFQYMNMEPNQSDVCPECGKQISPTDEVCPGCGTSLGLKAWERERDRLKRLWVISVAFFWFSVIFQGTLFVLDGTLNLVLLSVIGGMMILGLILKFRLQYHERRKPQQ